MQEGSKGWLPEGDAQSGDHVGDLQWVEWGMYRLVAAGGSVGSR